MIELHYWPTPNGWKITIMLEECGLPVLPRAGADRTRRSVQARIPQDLAQ